MAPRPELRIVSVMNSRAYTPNGDEERKEDSGGETMIPSSIGSPEDKRAVEVSARPHSTQCISNCASIIPNNTSVIKVN